MSRPTDEGESDYATYPNGKCRAWSDTADLRMASRKSFLKRRCPRFNELMTSHDRGGKRRGIRKRTKRPPVKLWTHGELKMDSFLISLRKLVGLTTLSTDS